MQLENKFLSFVNETVQHESSSMIKLGVRLHDQARRTLLAVELVPVNRILLLEFEYNASIVCPELLETRGGGIGGGT